MASPTKEKAYERYAWFIFLAIGIFWTVWSGLLLLAFLLGILPGVTISAGSPAATVFGSNPNAIFLRFYGYYGFPNGILATGVSLGGYRRGERWAWYTLLAVLVAFAGTLSLQTSFNVPTASISFDVTFFTLWLLGLVLPYRKFFPKKPVSG